jgi:hypothetical protein
MALNLWIFYELSLEHIFRTIFPRKIPWKFRENCPPKMWRKLEIFCGKSLEKIAFRINSDEILRKTERKIDPRNQI